MASKETLFAAQLGTPLVELLRLRKWFTRASLEMRSATSVRAVIMLAGITSGGIVASTT